MADDTASRISGVLDVRTQRVLLRGLAALRIFTGVVFVSNGLAKVFDAGSADVGVFSFTLITRGVARGIATDASGRTGIAPLGGFYRDVVLPHWGLFGVLLTVGELAIGIGLIFGIASRLAALGGLLFVAPIWIMLWHTNLYLWEYPLDLVPLLVFALVPAGRVAGFDRALAARLRTGWPF